MIITTHQQPQANPELIVFLQKIGISPSSINLGIRQSELEQAPLPIVLWSFGLLTLSQLQLVYEWEHSSHS